MGQDPYNSSYPVHTRENMGLFGMVYRWETVVPSDDDDLSGVGVGIRNNGSVPIIVNVVQHDGSIEAFNLPVGTSLSTSVVRVRSTGTTAADATVAIQVAFL